MKLTVGKNKEIQYEINCGNVDVRAVARPWRERRLPRAPDLRERKKKNQFKLKNYQLKERKYFKTQFLTPEKGIFGPTSF